MDSSEQRATASRKQIEQQSEQRLSVTKVAELRARELMQTSPVPPLRSKLQLGRGEPGARDWLRARLERRFPEDQQSR